MMAIGLQRKKMKGKIIEKLIKEKKHILSLISQCQNAHHV
jgi:hypothetical protein